MSDAELDALRREWRSGGGAQALRRLQEAERRRGIRYELGAPISSHSPRLLTHPWDVREIVCPQCDDFVMNARTRQLVRGPDRIRRLLPCAGCIHSKGWEAFRSLQMQIPLALERFELEAREIATAALGQIGPGDATLSHRRVSEDPTGAHGPQSSHLPMASRPVTPAE